MKRVLGQYVAEELKRTPLYAEHQKLGARLVPFAGWELPIQYRGIAAEHQAVRSRVGLFDVSHMGELELSGEHALDVVNRRITNDVARAPDGGAMYTCCCNESGTVLDDFIVYRHARDRILIVCNASNRAKIAAHFAEGARGQCTFRDLSEATALLALQGPKAFATLNKARANADELERSLRPFQFKALEIGGIDALVARTGYTGEDGVELFCASGDAVLLWQKLMLAGAEFGIEAVGLGARDTLRLEARLALYGNELDETINPIDAGLGWTVKFDKADFIGKQALLEVKSRAPTRRLVGFQVMGRGIARHGYPLLSSEQEVVGLCTSGAPAPSLGKNIGLGFLPVQMTAIGNEFLVDCRGKLVLARVVPTPFYKREKPTEHPSPTS